MSGTNEDITPAETAGRTEEDRELAEQLVEHAQSPVPLDVGGSSTTAQPVTRSHSHGWRSGTRRC